MKRCKKLFLFAGLILCWANGCGDKVPPENNDPSGQNGDAQSDKGKDKDKDKNQQDAQSDKTHDGQSDQNNDGQSDANSDNNTQDECQPNHFGANCTPCDCVRGTCDAGKNGTGACTCPNGTGWSGATCNECSGNFWGENCDQAPGCENGIAKLGVGGDGHCSACHGCWSGTDCDTFTNGPASDTMTDYDNNTYPTTCIGGILWTAKNMFGTTTANGGTVDCFANTAKDPNFVVNSGCLYTFPHAAKICPAGWRLPTKGEMETTLDTYGAQALKATSWGGTGVSGFNAVLAGEYSDGEFEFYERGASALFWSSTQDDRITQYDVNYIMKITADDEAVIASTRTTKGQSVR